MALTMRTSRLQGVSARRAFSATPVVRPVVRVQASAAVSEIVEKLKTLSLLEASELVAEIEKTFGVDASGEGVDLLRVQKPVTASACSGELSAAG